jgi:2',3'-cyclic-nucleotide 2'-phosphodiesterase/3'-nucleotidase
VAVNSYRGNGGGGHLTRGAGIHPDSLSARVSWSTDRDLRYYLMQDLAEQERLEPFVFQNWHCLPESWIEKAKTREQKLIR